MICGPIISAKTGSRMFAIYYRLSCRQAMKAGCGLHVFGEAGETGFSQDEIVRLTTISDQIATLS
jgi:hypothetical protein